MFKLAILVLHLVILFTILFIDTSTDAKLGPEGKVNHLRGAILRLAALLINIIALKILYPIAWELAGKILLLECSAWLIGFDLWLNAKLKQVPFHLGGGWPDSLFKSINYGDYWYVALKWSLFISALWLLLT